MASFKTIAIIPAICLTLLLGWFCLIQFNHNGVTSNGVLEHHQQVEERVFDFFLLSLQWPATYCRGTKNCCPQNGCCRGANSPTRFTIHGLWTDYNDGTWPSCCNGPAFNETQISTLYDALNTYWPTLTCSKASTCHGKKGLFWAHEWEKHGTCSFPIFQDEYDYFVKTLHLYFKYNVTEVLMEAGYVPSNTDKYSLEGIRSAIKNAYNATPDIECSGNAIEEVHLCFYKDFKPRDCDATSSLDTSCSEYVSLPAFASIGLKSNVTATTWHSRISSV